MPRLAGKVAFITGAGSGIGRATAILFASEGAKVAIAEIDASLQAAIRTTVDKFGRLDVLHNNAGGSTAQDDTAVDAPLDEFWRVIKLDLYGTFLGCRFGIPELIKASGGSVINMSSNVALMGVAGSDCYTAAKGGISAITRSLAVGYAPQRVRVNAIAPSATMTDRVKKAHRRKRRADGACRLCRSAASSGCGMCSKGASGGRATRFGSTPN
jgi:NAD(P)-dependent dehydrogenase (short-subunit alcohol dehydrogenase family)